MRLARTPARRYRPFFFPAPFRLRFGCLLSGLFISVCLPISGFGGERGSGIRRDEAGFVLETPLVRVGLTRFAGVTALVVRAEPGAYLLGPTSRACFAGAGPWTLALTAYGVEARSARGRSLGVVKPGTCWRVQCEDTEGRIGIALPGGITRRYRGGVEIGTVGGRLSVVNEVTLETYLRGVVISEMGGSAPLEALKAQAVAARTFALNSLGKWPAAGYDLRDSVESQVYNGADAETPNGDRAVAETSGLILTQAGHPIAALYCADCGGVTCPGPTPDALPRSISDQDAHGPAESPRPPGWTLTVPAERLTTLLNRNSQTRVTGVLDAIEITEKDISGRARRLRLTFRPPAPPKTDPSAPVPPDKPLTDEDPLVPPPPGEEATPLPETPRLPPPAPAVIREITGATLRSLLGLDSLRSTLFTVRRAADGVFVFEGRGWGHGRGMCQQGAMALAAPPFSYNYQAILNRYYAGAILSRVSYLEEETEREGERKTAPSPSHFLTPSPDSPHGEARHGR